VTSWLAMGVIGLIGIITLIRVAVWFFGLRSHHGSAELNSPIMEHDQLGDVPPGYDDDVQPLYP